MRRSSNAGIEASSTFSPSSPRGSTVGHSPSTGTSVGDHRDSVPDLLLPLGSADPHARQAACQALARPSLRGDSRVINALFARLQDKDQYVRQAAANSLGQVSRRGDEAAVAALAARLMDPDSAVRRLSATALGQIAQRGCSAATAALLGRLEDKDGGVRRASLKALEKVTEKSDGKVLMALFSRTADGEAFVRHTAVEVLSRLAEEGDTEVVSRLLVLLDTDRDARVRWAATEALGRLAVRGDSRVLTALLARLDDEADSVRRAAASALGHVTFAPLQELELQERHIAEIEFRGAHEVAARDKAITELEERHAMEVSSLQRRVDELEEKLRREVGERDRRIAQLEESAVEQSWLMRVGEFMPHASKVTRFLDTLPSLADPCHHGTEIVAPVWALRCVHRGPLKNALRKGGQLAGEVEQFQDGKDKRSLLSLFELFEQLSTGRVTPMELTEKKPLDVYVHCGEDDAWGLYCCSRHRMLALLMRQACARGDLLTVRCVLRPKDDQSFWGWHWSTYYDGGDGLTVSPVNNGSARSSVIGAKDRLDTFSPMSSNFSIARETALALERGGGSDPATPRYGRFHSMGAEGASGGNRSSALLRRSGSMRQQQPPLPQQAPSQQQALPIQPTSPVGSSLSGGSPSPGPVQGTVPTVTMELVIGSGGGPAAFGAPCDSGTVTPDTKSDGWWQPPPDR